MLPKPRFLSQARKADSGTIRMKRSLLVKAGEALAPDAFLLVLDSESDTKGTVAVRGWTVGTFLVQGWVCLPASIAEWWP